LAGQAAKLLELAQVAGLTRAVAGDGVMPAPGEVAMRSSPRIGPTANRMTELLNELAGKVRDLQTAWEEHLLAQAAPATSDDPAASAAPPVASRLPR
jgi:hypothetical protein